MALPPVLSNPLPVNPATFPLGQASAFSVTGSNLTSANVASVDLAGSAGVNWALSGFNVVNSTTLSLKGTPNLAATNNLLGGLTVTINRGTPNQSSGTNNNITYTTSRTGG